MLSTVMNIDSLYFSARKNIHLILLLSVFLLLRLYGIREPLIDMHNVRQTQTAMIARNLLNDNFNILYTRIDWDGDKPGIVVQEFPLYQLIVAVAWKIIGPYDIIGRLVSLAFSILAALYLFRISKLLFDGTVAYWTVAFFAICPMAVFMSRSFMINMMALSFSLVSLYHWLVWSKEREIRFALYGTLMFTLAALINLTTILPVAVVVAYLVFKKWENNRETYLSVALLATVFFGANLLWSSHAANVNSIYYPQWSSGVLLQHFLGLDVSRLDPYKWFRIASYFVVFVAGIHGVIFSLWGLKSVWQRWSDSGRILIIWCLGGTLYYLIFFNALAGHNYYSLPIIPLLSILIGVAVSHEALSFLKRRGRGWQVAAVLFVVTLPLWVLPPILHSTEEDFVSYKAGLAARAHSQKNDLILVGILHTNVASPVYPTILYYADRRGWNIATSFDPDLSQRKIDSLRNRGAKVLVLTYGVQPPPQITSLFPFYRYFSHRVDIETSQLIDSLKKRYVVMEEDKSYVIFRLS